MTGCLIDLTHLQWPLERAEEMWHHVTDTRETLQIHVKKMYVLRKILSLWQVFLL